MLWTLAWTMGVKRKAPGGPPGTDARVWPTSPGTALTLLTRGRQSEVSGTPSLSSSGSTQSARPSASVSGKPLSTRRWQSSSMPLQTSVVGVPGVQVPGAPLTQAGPLLWQAPWPQVIVPRLSSTEPLQSSSMPLQTSAVGAPGVQVWVTPPTQLLTVRWQAPTPHVVDPRYSSVSPLQSSSTPLHASTAPGWIDGS